MFANKVTAYRDNVPASPAEYGGDRPGQVIENRPRLVDRAIDDLKQRMEGLGNALETLFGRLTPVLSAQGPTCSADPNKVPCGPGGPGCQVAGILNEVAAMLAQLEANSRDVLSRLEV